MAAPRELNEAETKTVEQLAGIGCTGEQMAAYLGVSAATFDRILQRDERVREAVQKGRAKAGAKVMRAAFDMACSGRHPYMTTFWLRCKAGWKEVASEVLDNVDKEFKLNYKKSTNAPKKEA